MEPVPGHQLSNNSQTGNASNGGSQPVDSPRLRPVPISPAGATAEGKPASGASPSAGNPINGLVPESVLSGNAPVGAQSPVKPRRGKSPSVGTPKSRIPSDLGEQVEEASQEPEEELRQVVVFYAQPWLISAIVHMLILIVMALIMLPQFIGPPVELVAEIYAERLGDQLEFDSPVAGGGTDSLEEPIWTPPELPKVSDPFAAPPPAEIIPEGVTSTSDIQAKVIGYALKGREEGSKQTLLGRYGGTATTEAAVFRGLQWLVKQQRKDGSWSLAGPYPNGSQDENPEAATGLALLAFQGAGHTHKRGEFSGPVTRGWKWLLQRQDADGNFFHQGAFNHRYYTQGICTIALCEIYGMTKDKTFHEPALRAIDHLIKSQSNEGGWRYSPNADSDVSVTGWIVMALQSAKMAGFAVPADTLRRVERFLDHLALEGGSKYPYQKGREGTLPMTAEALLMRQFLGWKRDDPRLQKGVAWITEPLHLVNFETDRRDVYYWYYATQVCHHMEGDAWKKWNAVMRQAIPEHQVRTGAQAGSWDPLQPSPDAWANEGGRLYVTCLSIYCLEVYYRHLPLYSSSALRLVTGP